MQENLDLGGQRLSLVKSARQVEWLFEPFPILMSRQSQAFRTRAAVLGSRGPGCCSRGC